MYIKLTDKGPQVVDLPNGNEILLFAKLNDEHGYCVIYGPPEKCLSNCNTKELWSAKVCIGYVNVELEVYDVHHGHKYPQGGGFIEFDESGYRRIHFRLKEADQLSTFSFGDMDTGNIQEMYIVK